MKILAGIVLFNPDIERLKQNVKKILPQVDALVCIDNGSSNFEAVKKALPERIHYIKNSHNLGIAAALNQIMNYAAENTYDWFITLDQDSVCKDGLIEQYKKYVNLPFAALLTCQIVDRNFVNENRSLTQNQPLEIKECITSASFCRTDRFKSVGGFDEKMFIDSVDFEVCLNLRKHGYKIYRIPFVGLLHEVGHGRNVKLLWKKEIVYNHSALRNYYIARNHIYMAKKYPQDISMLRTWLREYKERLLILLYESNKWEKIKARKRGIFDAKNMKMGKLQSRCRS